MKRMQLKRFFKLLKLRFMHQKWVAWLVATLRFLRVLLPTRYLKILDWYIIRKFIGTYVFSILLIISIAIVFDVNENLAKFTQFHAPLKQ